MSLAKFKCIMLHLTCYSICKTDTTQDMAITSTEAFNESALFLIYTFNKYDR